MAADRARPAREILVHPAAAWRTRRRLLDAVGGMSGVRFVPWERGAVASGVLVFSDDLVLEPEPRDSGLPALVVADDVAVAERARTRLVGPALDPRLRGLTVDAALAGPMPGTCSGTRVLATSAS